MSKYLEENVIQDKFVKFCEFIVSLALRPYLTVRTMSGLSFKPPRGKTNNVVSEQV